VRLLVSADCAPYEPDHLIHAHLPAFEDPVSIR